MLARWYIAPYTHIPFRGKPNNARAIALDVYSEQIKMDGGVMEFVEVLGDHAIAKVAAKLDTLAIIENIAGVMPLPVYDLNAPLSNISSAENVAIIGKLLGLGYGSHEVQAKLPDARNTTLRNVLRFAMTRRIKPRWDATLQDVVFDGELIDLTARRDSLINRIDSKVR